LARHRRGRVAAAFNRMTKSEISRANPDAMSDQSSDLLARRATYLIVAIAEFSRLGSASHWEITQ
jgi:hypothetical protein